MTITRPQKVSNNLVGVAGEYYVCAELCRRNIVALVTPKNNPLFDVLASDPAGRRTVVLQVKTMSLGNDQGWKLGVDIESPRGNPELFVVLVNMRHDGTNEFYIYPYDELSRRVAQVYSEYMARPKRDGGVRKAVGFRWFDYAHMIASDRARLNDWGSLGF